MSLRIVLRAAAILVVCVLLLHTSDVPPGDKDARVRAYTRDIEFDYVAWTLNALQIKLGEASLGSADYLPEEVRHQVVLDYLELVIDIQQGENELNAIYADPQVSDPAQASQALRARLEQLYQQRRQLGPLAEAVLQGQLGQVIAPLGLSMAGQAVPPILYHSTPLPLALIVSPRDKIQQDNNISLESDLTLDRQVELEQRVDADLDVSSLVVGIGGVGVYPTMVMQTSDLAWLSEVVAHEWIHNYLTLRPLGISYMNSPELRTMNETAASIAGQEIGRALIERFYPERLPPPPVEGPPAETSPAPPEPPPFDFRAEMHSTRVTTDQLLAEGKIEEAEAYMEHRRVFFWELGYRIRKLNQAYFAFYGAYADQPGGAAGEDPVGAAVRLLRVRSASVADFIKRISWMSSYAQLQAALAEDSG